MLITYAPVGDPDLKGEWYLDTYARSGTDVIEIGIPSPGPYLDGPMVADSMARALEDGFDPAELAAVIAAWRGRHGGSPSVVWMAYSDSDLGDIERHVGIGALDGLLIVDGPRTPSDDIAMALADAGLGWCSFLPWDASDSAFEALASTTGYVMVQARAGKTGVGDPARELADVVARVRAHAADVPIVGGFGIRSQTDVAAVIDASCDGIVVGTKCIEAINEGPEALATVVRDLRTWLTIEQARRTRALYRDTQQ